MDSSLKTVTRYPRGKSRSENPEWCYDPVGSHLIELREYYHDLMQKLNGKEEHPANQEASAKKSKPQKPNFPIPKFPIPYPFSQSFEGLSPRERRLKVIACTGEVHKSKEKRVEFIKKVLQQTGFYIEQTHSETILFEYLSDILDDFLQKFVKQFTNYKTSDPFSKSEDLWGPLETTLRNFGIGGIPALHTFYYENVVKKHDILYRRCMNLYHEYKNT